MIEERRAPIEAHIDSLKELRRAYLSHYRFLEGRASEEYLSSILADVHQLEEEIMEAKKHLPPPMSQRQLRAIEEIPKAWAEVNGKKTVRKVAPPNKARKLLEEADKILNSEEEHLYRTELDEAERKLAEVGRIINQRFVDKAHEEALIMNYWHDRAEEYYAHRRAVEKQKEEELCKAADKTLQEYAEIAAGKDFTIHHSGGADKRFEGALEDDPATKQRKSLGRAILDLLNTKFK